MKFLSFLREVSDLRMRMLEVQERAHALRQHSERYQQEMEAHQTSGDSRADSPTLHRWKTALPLRDRQEKEFSVWKLCLPPLPLAFLHQAEILAWRGGRAGTSFADRDPLCEIRLRKYRFRGPSRWQAFTLIAPQDGFLLRVEKPSGRVRPRDPLAYFVPLPEWAAFVRLLDAHQEAVLVYRETEERITALRKQLAELRRDVSALERTDRQREISQHWQMSRLWQLQRQLDEALRLHAKWLAEQSLADCLSRLFPLGREEGGHLPSLLSRLSRQQRVALRAALQCFLTDQVPFSTRELRRLRPDLRRLARLQARFEAIDREILQALTEGTLSVEQEQAFLSRREREVVAFCREDVPP